MLLILRKLSSYLDNSTHVVKNAFWSFSLKSAANLAIIEITAKFFSYFC